MKPPKKIDIIIQPLRSAEGTKHEYIFVEALKEWINLNKSVNPFSEKSYVEVCELLKFIEQ